MKRDRSVKTLAALLCLTLLAATGCRQREAADGETKPAAPQDAKPAAPAAAASAGTDVGAMMPPYSAQWLDGSKFDLASTRGKVVLLNVWATWCGPCRYEIPELQAIHEEHASKGFQVIGVSVDESGADAVKTFIEEQEKMTYPVVLDEKGEIANLLETTILPTTVLLDREGKIVWKRYGAIMPNDAELAEALGKTL